MQKKVDKVGNKTANKEKTGKEKKRAREKDRNRYAKKKQNNFGFCACVPNKKAV